MLDEALLYARGGFPVFPLRAGAKEPAIPGPGGHLQATRDETQIRRWWEAHPDWNVGIRPPRNVVVVDVDPRNGGDVESLGDLPYTLCAKTGSGGWHLYFMWAGDHGSKLRGHTGIDVKGHNGYVVAPPSVHPCGGKYEWFCKSPVAPLPYSLVEAVRPAHRKMYIPDPDRLGDVSGLVKFVLGAAEGTRNNAFHWACRRAVEDGSSLDELADAALSIGLTEREVRNTMNSARSGR